jgi:hypothetical protein
MDRALFDGRAAQASTMAVVNWISDRVANEAAPNDCPLDALEFDCLALGTTKAGRHLAFG